MADNMSENESKETDWFSAELRMLEAEYEKSKLQVYKDTLFCKRSMVELELLCKNEQLQKNARVNNKLKEKGSQLQEQLDSLTSELKNATSQLQTAQNTLQDEKVHHLLEKKELEEKLNSEMERKMEEHKESASKRENSLQEKIKTWQDKHVEVIKEAENLRTELDKKNVEVKSKAVQAMVNVKNTSTMVEADFQTCEIGVQVHDLALGDDCSRKEHDVARDVDEDLRETNENEKRKKVVTEAKGKKSKKETVKENQRKNAKTNEKRVKAKDKPHQKCKKLNEDKENDMIDKEVESKRNVPPRRKSLRQASVASQNAETKNLAGKHRTTTAQDEKEQSTTHAKQQEEFHERVKARNACLIAASASQEDEISFQYSRTPGRLQALQKLEEERSPEKSPDQADVSTQDDENDNSIGETMKLKKRSKVSPKELPRLAVCVEDISIKAAVETEYKCKEMKTVSQDHENGAVAITSQKQCVENEEILPEEAKSAMIEKDRELLGFSEAQENTQNGERPLQVNSTERVKFSEVNIQNEKLTDVQEVNKKIQKGCDERKVNKRKQKSRQVKPAGEKSPQDEPKEKTSQNEGTRALRSRAKKTNPDAEFGSNKGEERKSLGKQTRQKPQDSDTETAAAKKRKTGDECFEGHDPAMLNASSHESDQCPRETDMSSREMDLHVDKPRPVTSRNPAGDDTSCQPDPEVLGGLNDGNPCAQLGEALTDYKSDQGSLVLSDNRIRKDEDETFHGCLHSALGEGKSPSQRGPHPNEQKSCNKSDLSSENNNVTRTGKQPEATYDVSSSQEQDLDTTKTDYSKKISRQTAKSSSRDTGHSRRDGQDPDPAKVVASTAKSSKENASDCKQKGKKKRKPARSVREVLAPADQQSNSDCGTSTEIPSMLDCTKKRKTLFNSRENSLMAPISDIQISFANATLTKSRANAGIPPSLSAFMRSFIAPKLKKSK